MSDAEVTAHLWRAIDDDTLIFLTGHARRRLTACGITELDIRAALRSGVRVERSRHERTGNPVDHILGVDLDDRELRVLIHCVPEIPPAPEVIVVITAYRSEEEAER